MEAQVLVLFSSFVTSDRGNRIIVIQTKFSNMVVSILEYCCDQHCSGRISFKLPNNIEIDVRWIISCPRRNIIYILTQVRIATT